MSKKLILVSAELLAGLRAGGAQVEELDVAKVIERAMDAAQQAIVNALHPASAVSPAQPRAKAKGSGRGKGIHINRKCLFPSSMLVTIGNEDLFNDSGRNKNEVEIFGFVKNFLRNNTGGKGYARKSLLLEQLVTDPKTSFTGTVGQGAASASFSALMRKKILVEYHPPVSPAVGLGSISGRANSATAHL